MLPDHPPTHVGEEETSLGVLWIRRAIGEFMMRTMVATKGKDASIHGQSLHNHEQQAQWPTRFERPMCPQAM